MKQQIVDLLTRRQRAVAPDLLREALNGFGMNRHQTPRFTAELTRRIQAARSWGIGLGIAGGAVGVTVLTAIALTLLNLAGAL